MLYNLKKFYNEIGLLSLAALFFFAQAYFLKPKLQSQFTKIAPPVEIKYLTMGLSSQTSDSFWLRSIQDIDDFEKNSSEQKNTNQSWYYNLINLTLVLDPQFSEAYYFGGLALTIVVKDMQGASLVFDKATVQLKYEWRLLYLAAYHALFEEHDNLKASRLYLRAADMGAPSWVRLSAGKLAAKVGDEEAANEILHQLITLESDPRWIKRLKEKLSVKK